MASPTSTEGFWLAEHRSIRLVLPPPIKLGVIRVNLLSMRVCQTSASHCALQARIRSGRDPHHFATTPHQPEVSGMDGGNARKLTHLNIRKVTHPWRVRSLRQEVRVVLPAPP